MKIGIVAPLWQSIPPKAYGGTQRVVYELVEGLVKNGHNVTLFACGTSKTAADLVSVYPRPLTEDFDWTNITYPTLNITEAVDRADEFDILHFHIDKAIEYLALPLSENIRNKTVFTLHFAAPSLKGYPDREVFLKRYKNMNFVSISNAQRRGMEFLNWVETVYNGINLDEYTFNKTPKDYFLWIGKFNPDKGTKLAVEAAKTAGVKLILAGTIDKNDRDDYTYYKSIEPLIDGKQVEYIGEVGGSEKDKLYGNATGFLNPIQWNEPFGLVMTESMATGTPVISFANGAAPEIIQNGKTGFLVNSINEMVDAIKKIDTIDRFACRKRVEENFTNTKMVDGYEKVYNKLLNK